MSRLVESAAIALAFVTLAVLALHPITSADVWWQLAAGEQVLAGGPPSVDPFSYGFPDRAWIEPRWLYCVATALVARVAGANGLILAKLAALAVAFALLGSIAPRRARWAVPAGLAAALALMSDRFGVRPELVSFVALALTLRVLEGQRRGESRRRLLALPIVQLVWNNAHTLWVLGPAVQWLWLIGMWFERPREPARMRPHLLAAIASTVIAPLNPWGLAGALLPLRLFSQIRGGHTLDTLIAEFRGPFDSPFLAADVRTISLVVVAALSLASFVAVWRRPPWSRLALWVAFAGLAVEAIRNVALFGLVAGAVLVANLADRRGEPPRIVRRVALVVPSIWMALMIPLVATDAFYRHQGRVERFGFGVSDKKFPIRALEFVRREALPRPVLHALGDGGYVLWEGGARSAYVDGRLEVYDGEIVARAAAMLRDGRGLREEADRLGVRTVVLRNRFDERGALMTLERAADWRAVYFDHLHVIYLRDAPDTREILQRLAIDWRDPRPIALARPASIASPDLVPGWWPRVGDGFVDERLGSLLLGMGNDIAARRHLEAAHAREPSQRRIRLLLGTLLRGRGEVDRADALLDGVDPALLERPDVRLLEGEIALRAGRAAAAYESFEAARLADPDEPLYRRRAIAAALAARRWRAAERGLREWLEASPRDIEAWNTLGQVLVRLERREEAAECLRRSLALDPEQPAIRALLGEGG